MKNTLIYILCILCLFSIPVQNIFAVTSETESHTASKTTETAPITRQSDLNSDAEQQDEIANYRNNDGLVTALICISLFILSGEFLFTLKRLLIK